MKNRFMKWISIGLICCLIVMSAPAAMMEAQEEAVSQPVEAAAGAEDAALEIEGETEAVELPGELESAIESAAVTAKYAWTLNAENLVFMEPALERILYSLAGGEAVLVLEDVGGAVRVAFDAPEGIVEGYLPADSLQAMTPDEAADLLDEMTTIGEVALYQGDLERPLPHITHGEGMLASDFTAISNNKEYVVQGKTIKASMVGNYSDCWSWARQLYYLIWGVKFTSDFQGTDKTGRNLIRNLKDPERQLTGENLKNFIGQSELGCTLRICSCPLSCSNIDRDGCPSHEKHSLIVVDKDDKGMVVMDNMTGNGTDKFATRYYTWDKFAKHWAKYKMVKYIKWPNAPEYVPGGSTATPEPTPTPTPAPTATPAPSAPTGILLESASVTMVVGETRRAVATVVPSDAVDKAVSWTSSDPFVAYVDGAGSIVAVEAGTATLTASTSNGLTAEMKVTVAASAVKPTRIKLDRTGTVLLGTKSTLQLNVSYSPAAARSELTWKTSKSAIAKVDGNGLVTPVKPGTCTIAVVTANKKKATVKVKVVDGDPPYKVKLDKTGTVTLSLGDTLALNATIAPGTAQSALTWKTSKEKVAKIDQNGVVTAAGEGTCTVAVVTANKKKATVKIKVVDPYKPTKVKLDKTGTVTLNIGDTLSLNATLVPATAKSALTWKTSKSAIAKIDENGLVTARAAGTCTVAVLTANGKKATVKVKVVDPSVATKVTLNKSGTVTLKVGKTLQLSHTLYPSTATTAVKWATTNKAIAAIDQNGLVTAKKAGSCTVGIITKNGKKATVKIKVVK